MINLLLYLRLLETELRKVGLNHEFIRGMYPFSYIGHRIIRLEDKKLFGMIYKKQSTVAQIISEPMTLETKLLGLNHYGLDIRIVDPVAEKLGLYTAINSIRGELREKGEDVTVTRAYYYGNS